MKPIPVSKFSSHVDRLHADRDKLFEMENEVSGVCVHMNDKPCTDDEVFGTIIFCYIVHVLPGYELTFS